jgi:hypothetical protein
MINDPEILAISEVYEIFKELDFGQRKRIVNWISDKFDLVEKRVTVPVLQPSEEVPTEPKKTSTTAAPVKIEKPAAALAAKHEPLIDLEAIRKRNKGFEKALLAGYMLHVKNNLKEFSGRELNDILKKTGHRVASITSVMHTLMKKNPPQLEQTFKSGKSLRYMITKEGMEAAKKLLMS